MEIKMMKDGEEIIGFYLLKSSEVRQTNGASPKDFLDIVLADKSGQITSKIWDVSQDDKETYTAPMVVKVRGTITTYREQLQVKIHQIRPANADDGISITDYIRSAPLQSTDMILAITRAVNSIVDDDIRTIVTVIINRTGPALADYPAAKTMHHDFYGGLAYHMVRMLELGGFLAEQRPFLNRDLLVAGIILHDIAKLVEYEAELGTVKGYSDSGKLLGHLYIAAEWVNDVAREMEIPESPKITLLKHMILAHHNLGEWGSPVRPQLPEAIALHYIDQIDAKLQAAEDALARLPESENWTPPLRIAENQQLYRMKNT